MGEAKENLDESTTVETKAVFFAITRGLSQYYEKLNS